MCIYIYIYIYVCRYIYIYIYIHTRSLTVRPKGGAKARTFKAPPLRRTVYQISHVNTNTMLCIYIYIYTYIHIHVHTYIYIISISIIIWYVLYYSRLCYIILYYTYTYTYSKVYYNILYQVIICYWLYMYTYVCVYMYMCIHIYIYIYMYIYYGHASRPPHPVRKTTWCIPHCVPDSYPVYCIVYRVSYVTFHGMAHIVSASYTILPVVACHMMYIKSSASYIICHISYHTSALRNVWHILCPSWKRFRSKLSLFTQRKAESIKAP